MNLNPPKFGDQLEGMWRSLIGGTSLRPGMTWQHIRNAQAEREARDERDRLFGSGEVGGNRNWSPPVHATRADGRPITISFGKGPRQGHVLVADGHITSMSAFYGTAKEGKGHDHLLPDGRVASRVDRHRSSE